MSDWVEADIGIDRLKVWNKQVDDGTLAVYLSEDGPQKRHHLSISHTAGLGHDLREPSREELYEARREFVPDEVFMAMLVPASEAKLSGPFHSLHLMEIEPDPYWTMEGE